MPRLLEEVYRLRRDPTGIDSEEQRLVKMFANLLESPMTSRNRETG